MRPIVNRIGCFLHKKVRGVRAFGLEAFFRKNQGTKRLHSPFTSPNVANKPKKQQYYVLKNRYLLFSNELEIIDDPEGNQSDKMGLETNQNETAPIATKPPPPIFIRTVTNFNSVCINIKEVTKGKQFTCKNSLNGVKLATQSAESYRSVIKFLQ